MEKSANGRIGGLVSFCPVRLLAFSLFRFLAFSHYPYLLCLQSLIQAH